MDTGKNIMPSNTILEVEKEQINDIRNLVRRLKRRTITHFDIPEQYSTHPLIVSAERKCGMRKFTQRGYDIIHDNFFVVEEFLTQNSSILNNHYTTVTTFLDFNSYYEFLQGDIYENACYYKYNFSQLIINKYSINTAIINRNCLIDYNIDDFSLDFSKNELKQYDEVEEQKIFLKEWINKFNECSSYRDFKKIILDLEKTSFYRYFKLFFYTFIFYNREKAFNIIMQFINDNGSLNIVFGNYPMEIEKSLCFFYEPQKVLDAYNNHHYSKSFAKSRKSELKQFIKRLTDNKIHLNNYSYYCSKTHYFVSHYQLINSEFQNIEAEYEIYFETFGEFLKFKNNNLSSCDFSKAIVPNIDFSKFEMNEHTILPIQYQKNISYILHKEYNRKKDCFIVKQTWTNEHGKIIKYYTHSFDYFFDFAYFLKYDLSNADLLFCDGLSNILEFNDLDITNARLQSKILDRLNIQYKQIKIDNVEDFPLIKQNEEETTLALTSERKALDFEATLEYQKIYYITDLHLLHRLKKANCKSINDEIFTTQKIIDGLLKDISYQAIILIGGDTTSDWKIFKLFVEILRASIDEKGLSVTVIFALGNHELWNFNKIPLNKIVEKYRKVLTENKMYLLQNNLIIKSDLGINIITTNELERLSKEELENHIINARLIIFGGLGFAGYNEKFNATHFIYKDALTRYQEIEESKKFEELYKKISADLCGKRVIIFTHMPQKDWCSSNVQIKDFIYVNGHTHRNYYYDDGDYRLYSDNQVGYYQETCRLKYFYLKDDYDTFERYKDGIFEITKTDYLDFYRGKNLSMSFNHNIYKLYMLKRNRFYMFITKYSNGNLAILNGGAIKGLQHKDLNYYFNNMDKVITYLSIPLNDFNNYQKNISSLVKSIGGMGTIHGAIIDIDYYSKIYINPIDFKITAYSAQNIFDKIVFSDVPTLLQQVRPDIYTNYLKQLESNPHITQIFDQPKINLSTQIYLDTDIYKTSAIIKKMQKLNSNILCMWVEPAANMIGVNNS